MYCCKAGEVGDRIPVDTAEKGELLAHYAGAVPRDFRALRNGCDVWQAFPPALSATDCEVIVKLL